MYEREHPPGFRWLTESFGTNWRMTEMQAAIGRIQLRRLPEWQSTRARNASILRNALTGLSALRIPQVQTDDTHAYYRFYAFVLPEHLAPGWSRDRILEEIERAGIPCGVGSCSEIYLERAFRDRGWGPASRLPTARTAGRDEPDVPRAPDAHGRGDGSIWPRAYGGSCSARPPSHRLRAVDLDGVGS